MRSRISILDLVFPVSCAACGGRGRAMCAACLEAVGAPPDLPPPPGVAAWRSPFAYEGVVREAVARVKYRNERAAVDELADALARSTADLPVANPGLTATWLPATRERWRRFGFDHAEVLARALARRLRIPVVHLLERPVGDGTRQTGRSRSDRRHGPVFRPARIAQSSIDLGVGGRGAPPILLVDDVATTGASLRNAARVISAMGYQTVIAATAARTPLKGHRSRSESFGGRVPSTLTMENRKDGDLDGG